MVLSLVVVLWCDMNLAKCGLTVLGMIDVSEADVLLQVVLHACNVRQVSQGVFKEFFALDVL